MFSGIVEAVAKLENKELKDGSLFLTVAKPKDWQLKPGDSICTNGACLTVKSVDDNIYQTELMAETLKKTYFADTDNDQLNLERPLKLSDRIHGHLVSGHVDTIGTIEKITKTDSSYFYKISFPEKFAKYVVTKGSIMVDGISLTIVKTEANWFTVSIVDYTWQNTNLKSREIDDQVHLEFDLIAKYLEKLTKK